MPHTISIDVDFCYGHRLVCHPGKCRHPHGHNGIATFVITEVDGLSESGMVMDFGVAKLIIKSWIDGNWDHNFLLGPADPLADLGWEAYFGRRPYHMPGPPTAENMAAHLYAVLNGPLGGRIVSVTVRETPNCSATFTA